MSYSSIIIPITLIAYILLIGAITLIINKKWLHVELKKFLIIFASGVITILVGFFMIPIHFP